VIPLLYTAISERFGDKGLIYKFICFLYLTHVVYMNSMLAIGWRDKLVISHAVNR